MKLIRSEVKYYNKTVIIVHITSLLITLVKVEKSNELFDALFTQNGGWNMGRVGRSTDSEE